MLEDWSNELTPQYSPHDRTWVRKFRNAFSGITIGVRGQSSFLVHGAVAIAVVVCAIGVRADLLTTSVLVLCIVTVFASELFNSALERMARAITDQESPHIKDSLNIASGAVLVASIGSAVIGMLVFGEILIRALTGE